MGKYINSINGVKLPNQGKVNFIIAHMPSAIAIAPPAQWNEFLVCVVDNGLYQAAAYAYDEIEMNRFLAVHNRPVQWLWVPNAKDLVD